ncbi:MAG: LacI family DNA-binding transcriptional regulator [Chitinophagales bacterium]
MKKGVTIKDIALKLNMSVSTVSKALNNDLSISTPTKDRVKQLADDWNYIPNEAARHFKLSKTFTLGLIIPDMLDQFFVLAINGAEKIAAKEKYNVIISQSHEDPANEERIVDLMKRNRVDGLIVVITKKTQDMSPFLNLKNIGIPVVFFARPPKDDSFDYVTADNEGGALKATEYLINQGHQRIGHLMGPECMAVSQLRLQGYKTALQMNNIGFDPGLVQAVDLTEESTFLAMSQFMKMPSPPTGIFTFKNYISLDAIEYLKKNFPGMVNKIDFAGFGNLPLFRYLDHKPVASIEESSYEMGEEAARLLFQFIKEEDSMTMRAVQHIQIHCKLVVHK